MPCGFRSELGAIRLELGLGVSRVFLRVYYLVIYITLGLDGVNLLSCYTGTSVARVLSFQDLRNECGMAQQPTIPQDMPRREDPHLVPSPTWNQRHVPTELQAQSTVHPSTRQQVRVRTHATHQVMVAEVAGRLRDVVLDLDYAIQMALAERHRGVVCDLSGVLAGAEPVAVEVLAASGRHVRDWPGIPVAVACPDPHVREALGAHPLGSHLIVRTSLFSAVSAVRATPTVAIERLQLAAHPTAPRASREFVARALLNWRLDPVTPFASTVVSELVASSSINAGTDIDLSVAWNLGALRLTVRDHSPALPDQWHSVPDLRRRGLTAVADLSRAFGVFPTADGGNLFWAVLEAPQPRPATSNGMRTSHGEPSKNASINKVTPAAPN